MSTAGRQATTRDEAAARGAGPHFPIRRGLLSRTAGHVHAADGVSLSIGHGETLRLVGESGCGKSTAGKNILKMLEPDRGHRQAERRRHHAAQRRADAPVPSRDVGSLPGPLFVAQPAMSAGAIVGEPLAIHGVSSGGEREERVAALFERVRLPAESMADYPHEFSGGQRQRIGITSALALNPDRSWPTRRSRRSTSRSRPR